MPLTAPPALRSSMAGPGTGVVQSVSREMVKKPQNPPAQPGVVSPLPWNDLLARPGQTGKSAGLILAGNTLAARPTGAVPAFRLDDSWLAKQRCRYNDEGDALLRAMLTVFHHGSPEANASARYDALQRLLQFDFLHEGLKYHVRAIVHEDGRIMDIHITDLTTPARCLHPGEHDTDQQTAAAFKRVPRRAGASSSLYQKLHTESRSAASTDSLKSLESLDRAALMERWRLSGKREALTTLIDGIAALSLDPALETLAYFRLFEMAPGESGKDNIAQAFLDAAATKKEAHESLFACAPRKDETEVFVLTHFAFASMAAHRLLSKREQAQATGLPSAGVSHSPMEAGDDLTRIRRSLAVCLDETLRPCIDPDRIFRKMEAYLPDYRRVLAELEKMSQALGEKLAHLDARAAMFEMQRQLDHGHGQSRSESDDRDDTERDRQNEQDDDEGGEQEDGTGNEREKSEPMAGHAREPVPVSTGSGRSGLLPHSG